MGTLAPSSPETAAAIVVIAIAIRAGAHAGAAGRPIRITKRRRLRNSDYVNTQLP